MKKKYKKYLKLNLVSIFFIIVSSISVTLAWFAYSGLVDVKTEIGVKAWSIKLEKDGGEISNNVVISLSDIYPGMDPISETVNITNEGDADAIIRYEIKSARILGDPIHNYVVDELNTSEYVEDILSHNYPFHININLSKNYAVKQGGGSAFKVSISWPLDSGDDELDSYWGNEAYLFQENENTLHNRDNTYNIRPSIQIEISVKAEQDMHTDNSSDYNYDLGKTLLFNPVNNEICTELGEDCITTHIIDVNNKIGNTTVTLLPSLSNIYTTDNWTSVTESLTVEDLLKVISTDITDSYFDTTLISDSIIGNLNYQNRMSSEITNTINKNGYYTFLNSKFEFLSSSNCYRLSSETSFDSTFVLERMDATKSKISPVNTTSCNVVPKIIYTKVTPIIP